MEKTTYTTILHQHRESLNISWLEYGLCDVVDKLAKPWCYMGRPEMARIMGVSERTIIRMLKDLEKKGLLISGAEGIKPTPQWQESVNTYNDKMSPTSDKLSVKKVTKRHDSIYISKDITTSTKVDARTEEEKLKRFPDWMGNSYLQRLVYIYSVLWKDAYGFEPTIVNWGQLGKQFSPLVKHFTEYQLAALIIVHFEWKGADGDSDFEKKVLEEKGYPLDWIPKRASIYKAYIMNSLNVKFDDEVEMKKWVSKIIHPLIKHDNSNVQNTESEGASRSQLQAS